MRKLVKVYLSTTFLTVIAFVLTGCGSGGAEAAKTIRWPPPLTVGTSCCHEVERGITQQAGGKQSAAFSASAGPGATSGAEQSDPARSAVSAREREKLLPTEDQIDSVIATAEATERHDRRGF